MADTYNWMLNNGIKTLDIEPMVGAYYRDDGNDGDSVGRTTYMLTTGASVLKAINLGIGTDVD